MSAELFTVFRSPKITIEGKTAEGHLADSPSLAGMLHLLMPRLNWIIDLGLV